ncbi:MAG: DUF2225 domain-containing protein [Lachnospiraceae bacterium]|nr:DUF2225 domain-containing protein [Lachnospiraceae bacterium]
MDNGIFSGLEDLGLGGLSGVSLFDNGKSKSGSGKEELKEEVKTPEMIEAEMLLDKTHECPICSNTFKNRALRTGKAKMVSMDMDLRQRFEGIEPLKYDVISCPKCGFTAVTRYFKPVTPVQRKTILDKISANYKPQPEPQGIYSYDLALGRYKLALANAVVKNAKASEKAYICLRAGWLCRSWAEELEASEEAVNAAIEQARSLEKEFLMNAYDGFIAARQSESFPMCGMDEATVDYLIGSLAMQQGHFEVSAKMIAGLLQSPSASPRIKDKARDLKEEVVRAMKARDGK